MPAKRLPWYKVWAEHTDHEKICALSDGEYRTWHVVIAKAAQQPIRWRFASTKHAAQVANRPERHIKRLAELGLMDLRGDGLWVHDWQVWQRWSPDDEEHANDSRTTHEEHANDPRVRMRGERGDRNPNGLLRDERQEIGDAPVGAPTKRATSIPEEFILEPEVIEWASSLEPPLDEAATFREAEKWHDHHTAKGTTARDWNASLRTWLRNASDIKGGRSPFASKTRANGRGRATWATSGNTAV